ncbi:hypothetical protein [Hymenobacter yonginensis]|uniref:Lipoprotein n=1 Tax=Hymenobacter yonginensis TaxID=748197 RepID=A0ABY7PKQ7_9BACT|nr:hypothetical protein [Hymenobacter yonginensis]WBO83125.1 hypothetical protein O9Z63_12120 [Hymenobacter yonginensis]
MYKPLRYTLFAVSFLSSCESTESEPKFKLPDISEKGANTLGFEVDDRVWINYGRRCFLFGGGCSDNQIRAYSRVYRGARIFSVSAGMTAGKRDEAFNFSIDSLYGPGTYASGGPVQNLPAGSYATARDGLSLSDGFNKYSYRSNYQNATRIVVTKVDTVEHIVSGTFEGVLEDGLKPGKNVRIRNGRFDVRYIR